MKTTVTSRSTGNDFLSEISLKIVLADTAGDALRSRSVVVDPQHRAPSRGLQGLAEVNEVKLTAGSSEHQAWKS
jgi:hypothetical protein